MMRRWMLLPFAFSFFASIAFAAVEDLTLLDQVQLEGLHLQSLSAPILGDNGAAYWSAYIDYELGGKLLKSESGTLASETRTVIEPGDFPLDDQPNDARGPIVLLSGTYFDPKAGGGYEDTGAIYVYPGFTRLVYFGSTFPGFTSDPVDLRVLSRAYLDIDNSVVFRMWRATSLLNFTYTICRAKAGAIAILAQTGVTAVPGGEGAIFTSLVDPIVDGGVILFWGEGGGRRGVYQIVGGVITKVVDNQTILPGNASPFFGFEPSRVSFSNDGLDVALALNDPSGGGVWKRINGIWSRIVAVNTPIPNGVGNFYSFYSPAIRDGKVVFVGGRDTFSAPPPQAGIYADALGGVVPVVDLSTTFVHANPQVFIVADGGRWFDGTDIAFAVQSTEGDDWRALYRATPVPEPASALAIAIAFATLAAIRRRRGA